MDKETAAGGTTAATAPMFFESESIEASLSAEDALKREAESINQLYRLPVQDDDDLSKRICGICKERLETIFDEDDEDWKYIGVVRNDANLICHFKCMNP